MLSETLATRRQTMLAYALGPAINAALADPEVLEVMVNPDGKLWLDRAGSGCRDTGVALPPTQVDRIIRLLASQANIEVVHDRPIVSTEFCPGDSKIVGERFEGLLPPLVTGPCFSIRIPSRQRRSLQDYVAKGQLTEKWAKFLRGAFRGRKNLLVAGATSSGKTTFANALLGEIADLQERIVLIEDTRELQCIAPDVVALKTRPGHVAMADLVRSTLRLRPDRIIVGEVRGGEALDLLKAWNTGHPGGLATIHANSAPAALQRVEQLVLEAVPSVSRALIAEAIDLIIHIEGRDANRRVASICVVQGLTASGDYHLSSLMHDFTERGGPS